MIIEADIRRGWLSHKQETSFNLLFVSCFFQGRVKVSFVLLKIWRRGLYLGMGHTSYFLFSPKNLRCIIIQLQDAGNKITLSQDLHGGNSCGTEAILGTLWREKIGQDA